MKHLKNFNQFEDVSNSTSAGMGDVSSSQPSSMPGSLNGNAFISGGGTPGSGDIGFTHVGNRQRKKEKRKVGKKSTKSSKVTFREKL